MKTLFNLVSVLFVALFISNTAFADIRLFELHRQKVLAKREQALLKKKTGITLRGLETTELKSYTFDQKLDHSDANDTRTFKQRYFINTELAKDVTASPVLLYICGEAECNPNKSILSHAKELEASVVYVEHRYYGKSMPTTNLTAENLKYLSTAQALEDLKAIQIYLQKEKNFKGKWVVLGGSYAGSLAAYYRLKNPDLVVGALSSSGPVMAKENFEEYDLHVSKVVGEQCGAKMKQVVKEVEALFDSPEKLLEVKKKFRGEALTDNVDFMYLIADMGALAVQYGYKDRFCELLDSENPLQGYAKFTIEIFDSWGMTALDMSAAGALDPNVDSSDNMRQWFYQSCTEYGYWQNAYHDEKISVRSSLINADYHRNICIRLYGLDTSGNEKYVNETYYAPLLDAGRASNIFYTNGSTDPWLNLSIAPENKNDSNIATVTFTMEGAAHCNDLGNSSLPDVKKGRQMFVELSKKWLTNSSFEN